MRLSSLTIMAIGIILIATPPVFAIDIHVSGAIAEKNMYRSDAGMTPVDGPVTEAKINLTSHHFDVFGWGAEDNGRGKINEVDIGLGYSFGKNPFYARVGITRWFFEEMGGNTDVLVGNLEYLGPVDFRIEVDKLVDGHETQTTACLSKTFGPWRVRGIALSLTPFIKMAYLDHFLGSNGHTNDIYGLQLDIGDRWNIYTMFHDGHWNGHKNLGDTEEFGIIFDF